MPSIVALKQVGQSGEAKVAAIHYTEDADLFSTTSLISSIRTC